ncbi:hypothetical protein DFH11DRAFT_474166 [Phellopilus nigrolimitatus]|nr:hypothetical protein DFH11DRAFT_474166 [Phellopilus nigrolimitatus]
MAPIKRTGSLPIGDRPRENVPPRSNTLDPSTSRTASEGQHQDNRDILTVIDFSKHAPRHSPSTKPVSRTNNASVRKPPPNPAKEPARRGESFPSIYTASRSSASRSVDLTTPPAGWWAKIKNTKEERRRRNQQASEAAETRMEILKSRIEKITQLSAEYVNKIGKDSLELATSATRLAPVTFIAPAAQSLLWMVDTLQFVQTNKESCVSLIERCQVAYMALLEIVQSEGKPVEGHVQEALIRVREYVAIAL